MDFKQTIETSPNYESEVLLLSQKQTSKVFRILYAEDDPINTLVMKRYLSLYNDINLVCVNNGLEAVQLVENQSPYIDLILMDCNMPVMDGYEAAKKITDFHFKKGIASIPIIAVTANVLPSDLQRCLDYGMRDFITKPFKREELRKKIDK